MTDAEFLLCCRFIGGDGWQAEVSQQAGVSVRTVQRWMKHRSKLTELAIECLVGREQRIQRTLFLPAAKDVLAEPLGGAYVDLVWLADTLYLAINGHLYETINMQRFTEKNPFRGFLMTLAPSAEKFLSLTRKMNPDTITL